MALSVANSFQFFNSATHTAGGSYVGPSASYNEGDLVLIIIGFAMPNTNAANVTSLSGVGDLSFNLRNNQTSPTTGGVSSRLITYWARANSSGTFVPSITHTGYVRACTITVVTISGVKDWGNPFAQNVQSFTYYNNGGFLGNLSVTAQSLDANGLQLFYFFSGSGDLSKNPVSNATVVFNNKNSTAFIQHFLGRMDSSVLNRTVDFTAPGGFGYQISAFADTINGDDPPEAPQTRPVIFLTG